MDEDVFERIGRLARKATEKQESAFDERLSSMFEGPSGKYIRDHILRKPRMDDWQVEQETGC